jgi:hypothetical protein
LSNRNAIFVSHLHGQTNLAFKAVDGKLVFVDYKEGWDAGMLKGPPDAPQPPPPPKQQNKTWQWDGKNGNNAVWFGSTKAGVRLEVRSRLGEFVSDRIQ